MRRVAFVLAIVAGFALADPPSKVTPQMVGVETSYVTIALSGTNNLRAALRWIDANWPTNIDIAEVYATETALDDYLLYTNLFDAGTEAGFMTRTYANTNYLAGTNISGASYNSSNKTWTVASQSGRLLDWMELGGYGAAPFQTNVNTAGIATAKQFTDWTVLSTSGAGRLVYDSGYVTAPSNCLVVLTGVGEVTLQGTNVASSSLRWYRSEELDGSLTNVNAAGWLLSLWRRDTRSTSDQDSIRGSGSVTYYTGASDVSFSTFFVYSQQGTNSWLPPSGRAVGGIWGRWSVLLYDAGL